MPLKRFHCSANLCLPFNIIPSVETFTQRADMGTNITLLSICDLPALHPPSECNATMEKSKGEGGRLPRYSGIYWWYTSSRIADSIQRTKVCERLQTACKIFCACRMFGFQEGKDSVHYSKTMVIKRMILWGYKMTHHAIGLIFTKDASNKLNVNNYLYL